MRDVIRDAMTRPDCILGVVPDGGGMWLSPLRPDTNRDFSAQSYTWDSFNAIQNTVDFSHDFTFEIEFECTVQTEARIFYISSTGSLFGLYQFSSGFAIFTTCLLGNTDTGTKYTEFTINQADTYLTGRHVAKMIVEGNTATAYLDNVVIGAANAEYINRVTPSNLSAPTSKCGYIYFMRLTDDTTGETIWQASRDDLFETNNPWPSATPDETPGLSEAERVRLLTKTNVRTDRGVFEAADTSKRWNVKTLLRWQNLTAATIMVRATVGDFPETVFSFGLPANPNYAVILLRRSTENQLYASILGIHAGGYSIYRTITTDFTFAPGKKETFCLVFNIDGNFMRLYANGELLAERTLDQMVALAVDGGRAPGFMLGTTSSSDAINSDTTVSYALVFDRALTAAEIAALS